MGKCAVIAFYAAVLLLAWWPWNVLLIGAGIGRAWSLGRNISKPGIRQRLLQIGRRGYRGFLQ